VSIPPAWHPDPTGRHDHRWWDGTRWTEHVADAGVASVDPLEGGAPAQGGEASAAASATSAGPQTDELGGEDRPQGDAGPGPDTTGEAPTTETQGVAGWGEGGGPTTGWSAPEQPAAGLSGGGSPPAATQPWGPATGGQPSATPAQSSTDGLAIAAGIVGIVSLVTSIFVFGALGGVVAIVLGAIAMGRVKRTGRGGRGMAITGLVTGILSVVVGIAILVVFSQVCGGFFGDYQECLRETGGDTEYCDRMMEDRLERRFFGD
jgi:hypothetical protein